MGDILTLRNIKKGNKEFIDYPEYRTDKDGNKIPLKIWENLKYLLDQEGIKIKYNSISRETECENWKHSKNSLLTTIYSLQVKKGLNMSRDEVANSIEKIGEENAYNSFVEMLEVNKNDDENLLNEVFGCLELKVNNDLEKLFYFTLFKKWCINVVRLAHNNLDNDFSGQGVLVLQGKQGCRKSTFCRMLIPDKKLFKGDLTLDTTNKDSIIQNTKYILVEWGELDSTLKGEQAKLKQFITSTNDEFRASYGRYAEKYPRLTSYIGTVNKIDFLKDETGSRRFWILPVESIDIETLGEINMERFWGYIYSLYLDGAEYWLNNDDMAIMCELNKQYSFESDISIILDEGLDWEQGKESWGVFSVTEISNHFGIKEKKKIKLEMERRGIMYKAHRLGTGRVKKGFKIPNFNINYY